MPYHNDTIINRRRKTSLTKYLPLTLLQGFEKVIQGLRVRGSWRSNINGNILTPTLMAVNVVSFSFSRCSTGGPGVHSAGCWLSLLHLSNFSGPQTPLEFPRAPSAGCGFPYHILSRTPSPTVTATHQGPQRPLRPNVALPTTPCLSLSPTLTATPTWTLEWHDWSSSSGNNCHAVHRSLSSGASVYECIMGFTLCHFISQIHPRDLFRFLAIGMCHFLPGHHLEWHFWPGRRSKYNNNALNKKAISFFCCPPKLSIVYPHLVM